MSDPTATVAAPSREVVITPRRGWPRIDWPELWHYRDLFYFMVWRDVRARYAQSVLGIGWAVVQPVFTMVVFTVVFGRLAQIDSEGAPYALFSFAALVPWTYFAGSLTTASASLTGSAGMLSKIYFPRLIIPLSPLLSKLIDFAISFSLLLVLLLVYGVYPTWKLIILPLPICLMMLTAGGLGAWLAALSVQYRDVRYALSFLIQLLMYAAPVVYPTSLVPERFRLLYAANPMVGVIESFRAALLATRPIPWQLLAVGALSSTLVAATGLYYFRSMEHRFADVV